MGRRLYLRLYFTFLAILLGITLFTTAVSFLFGRSFFSTFRRGPRIAAHLARTLPTPDDPTFDRAVDDASDALGLDVAVVDERGEEISAGGAHIPRPGEEQLERARAQPSWVGPGIASAPLPAAPRSTPPGPQEKEEQAHAYVVLVRIPNPETIDGSRRAAVAAAAEEGPEVRVGPPGGPVWGRGRNFGGPPGGWLGRSSTRGLTFLLAGLVLSAILLVPITRSITRRVELLASAADAFGRGDLARRSGVTGQDEVGRLGRSFDEMAARIESARRSEKELLANVSHELRTPLQRMKLALELIHSPEGAGGDPLRARISSVSEEIDELERLVSEVLTTARLDLAERPLARTRIDLRALLAKAQARAAQLSDTPSVELDAPAEVLVEADEVLVSRVLANLVDNARKYGGGTPVRLALREELRGAERRAVVVVSDGGAGFSPEDLPHVFEPFYRGQNARGRETGYGLGLALAKRVVEVHGGEIAAANQAGGGARVELRLPIAPAEV